MKPTVSSFYTAKIIKIENSEIRLQLWDIVDKEHGINKVYYHNAVGAIVVSSLEKQETLENAEKWREQIASLTHLPNGSPIPVVLVANQYDLIE